MYKSHLKCNVCNKVSKSIDIFNICSIPIPKKSIKTLNFYFQRKNSDFFRFSCSYEKQRSPSIGDMKQAISARFNSKPELLLARNADSYRENAIFPDNCLLQSFQKLMIGAKLLIRELNDYESNILEENKVLIVVSLRYIGEITKRLINITECKSFLIFDKTETLDLVHFMIYTYINQQIPISEGEISQKLEEFMTKGLETLAYKVKMSKEHENYYFDYQKTLEIEVPLDSTLTLEEFLMRTKKKPESNVGFDIQFNCLPKINKSMRKN